MSYSQWNQDVECAKLLRTLHGVETDGYYVDVGAFDGVRISNTKYFADRGWRGVCVEANPAVAEDLQRNRSDDRCHVVLTAVGSEQKSILFRSNAGYTAELSGVEDLYDPRHFERINREQQSLGGSSSLVEVQMRTLDSILEEVGAPTVFDFLSIDIEGGEYEALKGLTQFTPRIITVENNYPDVNPIKPLLEGRGYEFIRKLKGDDVYSLKRMSHQSFLFVPRHDSVGHDISQDRNATMHQLSERVRTSITPIAGFNTLGYVKDRILFPLEVSPYLQNSTKDGVYIAIPPGAKIVSFPPVSTDDDSEEYWEELIISASSNE